MSFEPQKNLGRQKSHVIVGSLLLNNAHHTAAPLHITGTIGVDVVTSSRFFRIRETVMRCRGSWVRQRATDRRDDTEGNRTHRRTKRLLRPKEQPVQYMRVEGGCEQGAANAMQVFDMLYSIG